MEVKNSSEQLQKILSAISAVSNQQRKESYSLLKYEIHKVVLPHMGAVDRDHCHINGEKCATSLTLWCSYDAVV